VESGLHALVSLQVFNTIAPTFGIQDMQERVAARKSLMEPGGASHSKMLVIEKLLATSKTKYYVGDKPSLADVMTFVQMSQFSSGCSSAFENQILLCSSTSELSHRHMCTINSACNGG
jgi:glutathione S-transferase